jgi:AAA15 family ATPase/GTPase
MEIKNIKIENFKNLESVDILTNHKINLIVGKNNTGKTSLIQALYITFLTKEFISFYKKEYNLSSLSSLINYSSNKSLIEIKTNMEKPKDKICLKISRPNFNDFILYMQKQVDHFLQIDKKALPELLGKQKLQNNQELGKLFTSENNDLQILIGEFINEKKNEIENSIRNDIIIAEEYNPSEETTKLISEIHWKLVGKIIEKIGEIGKNDAVTYKLRLSYLPLLDSREHSVITNILHRKLNRPQLNNDLLYINAGYINLRQFSNQSETTAIEIQDIIKTLNILPDLERFTFRNLVFKKNGIREEIPLEIMGEGFKVFVYIISMILSYKNRRIKPVILIEEPEIHMHPGYINEFVTYLINFSNHNNTQFFITTHSEDLINGFLNEDLEIEIKNKLKKEFAIIRLTDIKGENLVETMNYDNSLDNVNNLYLDLRGI